MNKPALSYDALKEFAKTLKKYMIKFGLETIDIAFLAYSTRNNIQSLLDHQGSLELQRMEAIAQAFNLHHYQFSNPDTAIPGLNALPTRTRKRIEFRSKNGTYNPLSRSPSTINEKIIVALSFLKPGDLFLTKDIATRINTIEANSNTTSSLIGDRLTKSFTKYIEKTNSKSEKTTGRGAKPFYYKLASKIPKEDVSNAVKIVGKDWFEHYKVIID